MLILTRNQKQCNVNKYDKPPKLTKTAVELVSFLQPLRITPVMLSRAITTTLTLLSVISIMEICPTNNSTETKA